MRSFAILLLATAVLAAPSKPKKDLGKRSVIAGDAGISSYAVPYSFGGYSSGLGGYGGYSAGLGGYGGYSAGLGGYGGYSSGLGYGAKILGAGVPFGNSLSSAYASGLEYGGGYKGGIIGSSNFAAASLAQPAALVSSASVLPSIAPAKTERITGVTLHREVQVPVPVPHPVPVEVTKHVPVAHPVPFKVERPVPVPVPQPVPVPVTRHVPVKVDRPYAVPVPQPVEVRVPQPVPFAVPQPVPVPVSVTKHVPFSVPAVAAVAPASYVVPSTVGIASAPVLSGGHFLSSDYSSGISGIASGHEFVHDLGASSLAPAPAAISGATLSSGVISSGLASGISSGAEHFGSFASGPAFGAPLHSGSVLTSAPFGAGIPFKKW